MRWTGHVALCRRGKLPSVFRWGNLREGNRLEDPSIDERIILRWIFKK
jgi:hypothetical protein